MKKISWLVICILLLQGAVYSQIVYDDSYEQNPNYIQGLKYLESSQYSSAINSFKKAIRVNPSDESALIGLSNAYNMRAQYYNNTVKATNNAISDLKSALFFMKYYSSKGLEYNSSEAILAMEKNLNILESVSQKKKSDEQIYQDAKKYRTKGEFAASAYDYYHLLSSPKYKEEANSSIADIYKIFNRPDKSIYFYKAAMQINPSNTDLHLKLARTYEEVGNFSSSLKEYSYALETSSEREDILSSLERIWQKKVDETPKDAEAHANLGVVYQKEKRYNEAMEEYKKAEILNPSNINTKINIATLFQEQKKYNEALNAYNAILQSQPQNTDILLYKAQCLKELKRNDEAIALYKSILNNNPNNSVVKADLFELIKSSMPTEEVLDFLYKDVQKSPMNADSYYQFAYELHNAGKIDDAIVYYLQTIKIDRNKIDAYINLSQAYRQKKNYNDALSIIEKAKALQPTNQLVIKQYDSIYQDYAANNYTIASNYFDMGDYQNAIMQYSSISPQTADSMLGIAACYQALKNNAKAIEYYKKAFEKDNSNKDIPYYIATLYAQENDLNSAKTYVKSALQKNPDNSQAKELLSYIVSKEDEIVLNKAIALYEEKKYNDAILLFDKIINNSPENATVYYYRAMSFDALNNYQSAIADYKSVLKFAPDMVIAYYSLGVDYDLISNFKAAKQNYQKYVELSLEDNEYRDYAKSRIKEIK